MPTSGPVETGDLAFDSSSTDLSSSEEDVEAASEGQTSYRSFTTYFGTQLTKALVPLHDSCFCRLLHSPSWYHKEIRRSSAAHRRALCRCGAIVVLSIAACFWPWFRFGLHAMEHCDAQLASLALAHDFDTTHAYQRLEYAVLASFFAYQTYLVVASQLQWWYMSRRVVAIRCYVICGWLLGAGLVAMKLVVWCDLPEDALEEGSAEWVVMPPFPWVHIVSLLIENGLFFFVFWQFQLIGTHLQRLEYAFDRGLGSRWILIITLAGYVDAALCFACEVFVDPRLSWVVEFFKWSNWLTLASVVVLFVLGGRGFLLSFTLSRREVNHCKSRHERMAAERVFKRSKQLLCEAPLSLLATLGAICAYAFLDPWEVDLFYLFLGNLFIMLFIVTTSRFATVLGGIPPPFFLTLLSVVVSKCLEGCRRRRRVAVERSTWSSGCEAWDSKVRELGLRGVSLGALLDFYWKLGSKSLMPHYDPAVHTTADVTRQAIIPATKSTSHGTCALATLLMNDRDVLPEKLVTHTWSNKFVNLVAAVVADALDTSVYEEIVERLSSREERHALGAELFLKNQLDRTYWICSVSVNQHMCICDHALGTDSTGVPFYQCECDAAKQLSNTPPTRSDNQSINCEMNKFDDMMMWLASMNKDFGQCIAVGTQLDLFTRAWCVAEIHCAYVLDMAQSLRLFSAGTLQQQREWLRDLRVETMESANPDDKHMILAKIGDTTHFNKQVQRLIHCEGGLLCNFHGGMCVADALHVLARRARERHADGTSSTSSSEEDSVNGACQSPI
eukprot:TRINITY_DN9608_c0_g1_i2.p1 TRINITY_DN9608_c0_g1~~TRINITY_DN9608_c0_g1_i2.p1  ORF type:complete len:786 (-),score=85.13 TRINITY_DN9608_c0_g1_i2:142-2499(-)